MPRLTELSNISSISVWNSSLFIPLIPKFAISKTDIQIEAEKSTFEGVTVGVEGLGVDTTGFCGVDEPSVLLLLLLLLFCGVSLELLPPVSLSSEELILSEFSVATSDELPSAEVLLEFCSNELPGIEAASICEVEVSLEASPLK